MELLGGIADSFVYVVSRMGVTGVTGSLSDTLPTLLTRVHKFAKDVPTAVGFGISTREQFESVGSISEGVVIGSQLVTLIGNAPEGKCADAAEEYCRKITGRTVPLAPETTNEKAATTEAKSFEAAVADNFAGLPARFGEFGGQYVPESLMECLAELEAVWNEARDDPAFWEEFRSYYQYMGRPSSFHLADRLTAEVGGARIWLKREDLNHTGSHKINNALGQVMIARRLGKTEIIAETGAGQHGVATATICAKFGMKCTIYMGAEDVRRQALNVFRIRLLGAEVVPVESGSRTLRDAVNEALRAWVARLSTTHYVIGSAIGPHPVPKIVRALQSVIGSESRDQFAAAMKDRGSSKSLPDAVVACVGGGSNATGMFAPFVDAADASSVQLIGIEAGGDGVETGRHAATLTQGTKGVLHGVRTYVLQNSDGQINDTHSVSAGLDYPGVGPELSSWKDSGRASFRVATDANAFVGFRKLSELEGIIPALESSHAVWGAMQVAKELGPDKDVIMCLSGRGDKDVQHVIDELPRLGPQIGWDLRM